MGYNAQKYVASIQKCVNPNVFHNISKETKADVLWNKLKTLYKNEGVKNKALLIEKLVNLKYIEVCSNNEHISDFWRFCKSIIGYKLDPW